MSKQSESKHPSTEHALFFLEDVMGRCMTPFFLLNETADQIVRQKDTHPLDPQDVKFPITVGIRKTDCTEYFYSTLKMFIAPDAVFTKNSIKFNHLGTPVTIKIIHRKFAVLKNLDSVFYKIASFQIPNPFKKYWKMKGLIK